VETLSIACCFGGVLSAPIKQQSFMSGVWYFTASALEMEKEEGWFVLRHVGIEAFYPSRFLCSWSWFSTSATITENFLQSWLPCEADQVGAGSSCSTSWYFCDASVSFGPSWSQDFDLIWDTGASAGLMPYRSDFIDYVECEIDVCDITKVNKVVGIGTMLHKFVDNNGNHVYLPCVF
jgi:hypothetical protein